MTRTPDKLIEAARNLRDAVEKLRFSAPVTHVYNPLVYAWAAHETYLRKFGSGPKRVVFLGMNPGPFGMVQTGVPFGEIVAVRDWLGIKGPVARPSSEHPQRPILGFECPRSEISGKRLWGLFAQRFGSPDAFFAGHFVANYCPLAFLKESGANFTPDKLPAKEAEALAKVCDAHLRAVLETLEPQWVIGIGGFAGECAQRVVGSSAQVGQILHPSPASPAANKDWPGKATEQLCRLGVW